MKIIVSNSEDAVINIAQVLKFQSDKFLHSDKAEVESYSDEKDVEFTNVVRGRYVLAF